MARSTPERDLGAIEPRRPERPSWTRFLAAALVATLAALIALTVLLLSCRTGDAGRSSNPATPAVSEPRRAGSAIHTKGPDLPTRHRSARCIALFSLLAFGAAALAAQASPASVQVAGFLDVYAAYNSDRPADHTDFGPTAGTVARHAGELALNLVALELRRAPSPVGFDLVLASGDELEVLHSGEAQRTRDALRFVYQASFGYQTSLGRGLRIDAGIFPCQIGFESALTRDNWNYTHSWLGNYSPFYQAGVKLAYSFTDHLSGELHVLNGWQIVGDNNRGKSLGTKLAWSYDDWSLAVSTHLGPELPNDSSSLRSLVDVVATAKLSPRWQFAGEAYRGGQQYPYRADGHWYGVGVWLRAAATDRHAVALRLEQFQDDGSISGSDQRLREATVTWDARVRKELLLRAEARRDLSTAAVFPAAFGDVRGQTLLVLSGLATF